MVLIPLLKENKLPPTAVGSKAYNLCSLKNLSVRIVEGYVIPTDVFEKVVAYNNVSTQLAELDTPNKIASFRERIKTFVLPEDFTNELYKKANALGYPVILRSSSPLEDLEQSSMAGMFLSKGPIDNQEALIDALLEVWASAYYNNISENQPIAVIIQKYVTVDLGGVLFSRHPLGKTGCYGEYSANGTADVVNGLEARAFELNGKGSLVNSDPFIEKYVSHLFFLMTRIQKYFNYDVDMEWGVVDGEIYVFQVRPMTAVVRKKKQQTFSIIDVDDREALQTIEMEGFYDKYMKWFDKRHDLRAACLKHGVHLPVVKYLFYNEKNLDMDALFKVFEDTEVFKIEFSDKVKTRSREELKQTLREYASASGKLINIVRIQQVTATNYCGNACISGDDSVYIEFMPGGFGGFLSGKLDFSRYILDGSGQLVFSDLLTYRSIWKMHPLTKRFIEVELNKPVKAALPVHLMKEVEQMARSMNREFPNIKIEFEATAEKAYFNDATLEKTMLPSANAERRVLSEGSFSGVLEFLTPETFERIKCNLGTRSIVAESEFILKSRHFQMDVPAEKSARRKILVAPYPDPCLSVMFPYYEGFIFERGGLLSHLAILLREHDKPAIVDPEIIKFSEGACVTVKQGQLMVQIE